MNMMIYMLIKFGITVLSVSVQLPAGVIFPLLTCGAVYGRLFGYILEQFSATEAPGVYAAVGAAALVCATTHSVSVAIIVFELTGEIHYLIPMIVGVFFSYGVSSSFTVSYYDSMLEIKSLPYLPSLKNTKYYSYTAKDILNKDFPCLKKDCTLRELTNVVLQGISSMIKIPIIDENRVLGC